MKQNSSFLQRVSAIAASCSIVPYIKHSLRLIPLFSMLTLSGNAWGAETVLFQEMTSTTKNDYFKTYTIGGNSVEVVSPLSISSKSGDYFVQLGSTPSSGNVGGNYVGVKASSFIKTVSFCLTDNGTNKSVQPAAIGWKNGTTIQNGSADVSVVNSAVTIADKGLVNAQWITYDFSGKDVVEVRLFRAIKGLSVDGKTENRGNGTTCQLYGIKIELESTGGTYYAVTYELNGGEGTAPTLVDQAEGAKFFLADAPTRTGYTFDGWNDGTATYQPGDSYTMPGSPVTFTAQWTINTYIVSFDLNGKGNSFTQQIEHGSKATEPTAPTAEGFIFGGWYTEASCADEYAFPFTTPITAPITLYAKWTEVVASGYCISVYNSDADGKHNFIRVEGTNEYIIPNFTIPAFTATPNYWVGENDNWSNVFSANANFADMPLTTNAANLKLGDAGGATGTLHIWDDNKDAGSNLWIKFTPDGYGLCWGAGTWNADDYLPFISADGVTYTTAMVALTAEQLAGWSYYVGYKTANSYVYSSTNSETKNLKTIGVYANNDWWSGNIGGFFTAGQRGVFRMWADNADAKNWQCHFVPYYGLCYNANYPAGVSETAPADTWSDFVSVEENRTLTLAAAPVAPAGYIFKGWTTAQDGTGDLLNPGGDYALNNPVANTTLYAQWEENIMPQCGTIPTPSGNIADATMTNDVQIYSINSNGYSNGTYIKENTSAPSHGVYSNRRVVIKFPVKTKKITIRTYRSNNSDRNLSSLYLSSTFGTTAADVNYTAIEAANYTHTVSGTKPNWEHEFTFTEAIRPTQYLRIEWDGGTDIYEICYEHDATPDPSYMITFDNNGYGTTPVSQTVTAYSLLTKPEDPVADDKLFKGWYINSECTTEYDFSIPVTSSFTLYAKWSDIPCFSMEITATSGSVAPNVPFTDAQAAIVGGTVVCDEHTYSSDLSFGANGANLNHSYYLKVTLDGAVCLSAGTKVKITYTTGGTGGRGIKLFASDKTTEILAVTNSANGTFTDEIAITSNIEEQVFYIMRATGNGTYIKSIEITNCGILCLNPVPALSVDNAVLCSAGNVTFTVTNYAPSARLDLYRAGATEADPATLLKTIESATGESMTFEPITVDATYFYYVVATADCERPSELVTVTLAKQPSAVTISGVPTEAAIGETYTFTATLVDGEGADFQWYRNGNPIDGATAATYEFTPQKEDELQNIEFSCRSIGCGGAEVSSAPATTLVVLNSCYYITREEVLGQGIGYDFGDFVLYTDGNKDNNYNTSTSGICASAAYRYYTTGVTVYLKNYGVSTVRLQGRHDAKRTVAGVEIADALDGVYIPLTTGYTSVDYTSTSKECGELGIENVQIPKGKYVHITFANQEEFRISGLCVEGLKCRMPALAWSLSELTCGINETPELPTLTNDDNLPVVYSSSNETVATIDATGAVTIIGQGTTVISANFGGDDALCAAVVSYVLTVTCGDDVPQIAPEEGTISCTAVELRLLQSDGTTPVSSGNVQWYRDGVAIDGATGYTYTATTAGEYTATLEHTCTVATSNKAVLASIVTPPVAKAAAPFRTHQIQYRDVRPYTSATRYPLFTLKPTGTPADGGKPYCFSLVVRNGKDNVKHTETMINLDWVREDGNDADGTIRLGADYPALGTWVNTHGFAVGDTVWLTVHPANSCGEFDEFATATIPIKLTDKYSIAYIITGTVDGDFYDDITPGDLGNFYRQFRASYYEITPVNGYAKYDFANYEPYDLVILTDYPKATGNKKQPAKVNALADLVDKKPILSFKAHMADQALDKWKALGFVGSPEVPSPAQTKMDVLCFSHQIFTGKDVWDPGTDYRITLLSNTSDNKGLQGFTELSMDGFVNIATIDGGPNGSKLITCCERQTNVEARMMVLSIYSGATQYITESGMKAVDKILEYLLWTDPVRVSDCAVVFDNGGTEQRTGSGDNLWSNPANWEGNTLPTRLQNVRIEADCEVSGADLQVVSNVRINDKYKLVITPDGKLGSLGKFSMYTNDDQTQISDITSPDIITIQADATGTGALLHTHTVHPLVATVQLYSPARIEMVDGKKNNYWSYVAIPVQEAPVPQFFRGAYTHQWDESNPKGWERYGDGTTLTAFSGCALSQPAPATFTLTGNLAIAQDHTFTLTKSACGGINIIGNSWTAPIQISLLQATDFGEGLEQTVYIYNTGRDQKDADGNIVQGNNDNNTPGQWRTIPIETAKLASYTGPKVIPAMQAFEIDFMPDAVQTQAALTINYNRAVRTSKGTELNQPLYAPRRKAQADAEPELMRISVEDSSTKTDLWLLQDDRFSVAFDNGWDGRWSGSDGRAAGLWAFTPDGDMAVSAQPVLDGTTLGFTPGRENVYTFTFAWEGETLYLNDMLLQRSTRILTGNTYTFTALEESAANRFVISRDPYQQVSTSLADVVLTGDLLRLNNPAGEMLDLLVYDAAGRLCTTQRTAQTLVEISLPAAQGVYMICVRGTMGDKVYKVVR